MEVISPWSSGGPKVTPGLRQHGTGRPLCVERLRVIWAKGGSSVAVLYCRTVAGRHRDLVHPIGKGLLERIGPSVPEDRA